MTPTVNRRDIHLVEETQYDLTIGGAATDQSHWTATLDGPLSTGEYVYMARSGKTSDEALANLVVAINENGWEVV